LEPEILIVDEVLAVGDAEFQKKCLGRMKDVSVNDGRTILFVSHNMGAVKSLCDSGLYLKEGEIAYENNKIEKVVNKYYEAIQNAGPITSISERTNRQGNGNVKIYSLNLINSFDNSLIELGNQIGFNIKYSASLESFVGKILLSINNSSDECILFMDSTTIKGFPVILQKNGEIEIKISEDFGLPVGNYHINIAFFANDIMADYVQNALLISVVDGLFFDSGKTPIGNSICYVQQSWNYHANYLK
jgi:lipopolysaccharide transport system ATP-binding protein